MCIKYFNKIIEEIFLNVGKEIPLEIKEVYGTSNGKTKK